MMVVCDNRSRGTRELSGEVVMFSTLLGIWVTSIYAVVKTQQMHT